MNADKIRELCEYHRITLKELSDRIDRKPQTMQSILKNGSTNTQTLESIAKELGVHPGIFFSDSPYDRGQYDFVDDKIPINEARRLLIHKPASMASKLIAEKNELENEKIDLLINRIDSMDKEVKSLRSKLNKSKP